MGASQSNQPCAPCAHTCTRHMGWHNVRRRTEDEVRPLHPGEDEVTTVRKGDGVVVGGTREGPVLTILRPACPIPRMLH
jgi:hypothetical protein